MITTLSKMLINTLNTYPKDEFMLYKKEGRYVPISTAEFGQKIKWLALGLYDLGFAKGDKLCLLSENRPEWTMVDFAVLCSGGLTVPIYTTLVSDQINYIIDDSDAKIVVVSNLDLWQKIESIRDKLTKVKHFILMADEAIEGVLTLSQVVKKGQDVEARAPEKFDQLVDSVNPDDEASLIYTSGTTGLPKGVILTHNNFLSNVRTSVALMDFSYRDTVLSFLPLSHVLERMVMFSYIYVGATIAFAESIDAVAQNLLEIRPNIMVSVPRVFEKIYSRVMDQVLASPPLRRKIFFWALKVGKKFGQVKLSGKPVSFWLRFRRAIANKLVFSKIVAKTGGRIRFFVSGGAPLSRDIAEFFYAIGLIILEGYGLTETSPVLAVNTLERPKFGTVGPPIPGVEIKIAPDGEILARGPNIMKGYYKKENETREVFEEGWFRTGDIGHFDEDGYLVITDRKKDLIITSGGKNVAPQPIENILKTNPYISSVVVIGDRRKFISALIVPNFEKIQDFARSQGIIYSELKDLVANNRILDLIKSEIDKSTTNLASYEKIKKIALLDHDFEIAKGEITPTLKVRRASIEQKYRDLIEEMYREEAGEVR